MGASAPSISTLPRKVFDGFGVAQRSVSPFLVPASVEDLRTIFERASNEGFKVGMRGSGRSYGDAALNGGQLVVDMRQMNRILSWDPTTGIADCEPGVTIEQLWRSTLQDGYWPAVVPGTMAPTLGGCVAMNVHGKNHFKVGGTGDQVLDLDLLTPKGELLKLSREENADLFHAVIAGFGMLGTVTRVKLKLKHVGGGRLRVRQIPAGNFAEQIAFFDKEAGNSDYLVSWVDCIAGGEASGRAQIHQAWYTGEGEDPRGKQLLAPGRQDLPATIMGVPRALVGQILKIFSFNAGMRLVNLGKYLSSRFGPRGDYLQGHVAFAFLLDYVPDFRFSYGPGGFLQYQPFVPKEHANAVFNKIVARCREKNIVSYLGVMKRHRPDNFLLSHVVDGYSLAMDFPVKASNRAELWKMTEYFSDLVVEAGGRFYPAKDSVIRPQDFRRAWGQERISAFRALRRRVDPDRILRTEWAERVGVDE